VRSVGFSAEGSSFIIVVLYVDTVGAGVDVEPLLPEEAYQGDTGVFGVFYGQAGRRPYGNYHFYTGHGGFLNELKAGAAAEQQDRLRCGEPLLLRGMADELVEGVMAADVFAESHETALVIEETCGMETAGGVEDVLAFPEEVRERVQEGGGDGESGIRGFGDIGLEAVQGSLATDAAAGAGVGMALGAGEIGCRAFRQEDGDGIWGGSGQDVLCGRLDDAFGIQPAEGELFVVTRGAHGDGETLLLPAAGGAVLNPDLQRVFDRDRV